MGIVLGVLSIVLTIYMGLGSSIGGAVTIQQEPELAPTDLILRPELEDEWRAILFYHPKLVGRSESLIDSPEFFLHPDGKFDAEREFLTFLEAIRQTKEQARELACRFPRRAKFVSKHYGVQLPSGPCTEEKRGIPEKLGGATLVFSSYFLESPASFFGHLYIHLVEEPSKGQQKRNVLLDPVVNFSAVHGNVDFLTYMVGGLLGWFPGIFEILPMHYKIQQYANHESRDLWEFPLHFDSEELENLRLTLKEVVGQFSWYFYFSRNCSLLLAKLLQAADPQFELSARYRLWSTPTDILRRVVQKQGSPDDFSYTPSNRSRYLGQYDRLVMRERATFASVLAKGDLQPLAELSPEESARILDTVLEFIDFDNRLTGSNLPERYASLRQNALVRRSRNPVRSLHQQAPPRQENPAKMIGEQSLKIGVKRSRNKNFGILGWRPTLKSLLTSSLGLRPEMGMEMFSFALIADNQTLKLYKLDILRVENYQPSVPHKRFLNLSFRLSYGMLDDGDSFADGMEVNVGANHSFDTPMGVLFGEFNTLGQWTMGSVKDPLTLKLLPAVGLLAFHNTIIKAIIKGGRSFDVSTQIKPQNWLKVEGEFMLTESSSVAVRFASIGGKESGELAFQRSF